MMLWMLWDNPWFQNLLLDMLLFHRHRLHLTPYDLLTYCLLLKLSYLSILIHYLKSQLLKCNLVLYFMVVLGHVHHMMIMLRMR